MEQAAVSELDERVPGRRWMVRLDAVGRGSTAVRISCSRPACRDQRHASATAGRTAAIAHLKAHLRAAPVPRAGVYCACRAEGCHTHLPDTDRPVRGEPWRCGGPVVLAVITDRSGRWWQAMECCSRCAAATPGAKTVATAQSAHLQATKHPAPTPSPVATTTGALHFSDHQGAVRTEVPVPRTAPAPARRRAPQAKIAQRTIPHDLRPVSLRDELIELGDLFRAYQVREQPDLGLLADLQERKARAFASWADATSDGALRWEARRAEQAAATIRLQHQQRTDTITTGPKSATPRPAAGCTGSAVARLLTVQSQWEHVRTVLAHVAGHAPLPGPEARLLVLVLTLRTAQVGAGNLVGQDLTALGLTDPQDLVEKLCGCGWLQLPGTAADLIVSRPENPTPITIPSLVPGDGGTGPFTFGKKMRPKLSGWAQKVISDKKLRKAKATAGTRLLALTLATQSDTAGRLGPDGHGITLNALTTAASVEAGELGHLVHQLTQADWLTDTALTDTHLAGQLTERVLPLTCPLPDRGVRPSE